MATGAEIGALLAAIVKIAPWSLKQYKKHSTRGQIERGQDYLDKAVERLNDPKYKEPIEAMGSRVKVRLEAQNDQLLEDLEDLKLPNATRSQAKNFRKNARDHWLAVKHQENVFELADLAPGLPDISEMASADYYIKAVSLAMSKRAKHIPSAVESEREQTLGRRGGPHAGDVCYGKVVCHKRLSAKQCTWNGGESDGGEWGEDITEYSWTQEKRSRQVPAIQSKRRNIQIVAAQAQRSCNSPREGREVT
ncbi:hypothetical protein B0H10DRAFT_2197321 [Mycena sp. CBHHK59/15]|nr:hypothetical protein B0H10DRAFT_2197321 [Mycena sp. CBHHK59/15]